MKGRESGMPHESYWETFFNPACILDRLGCSGPCGDVVEFGCGYTTIVRCISRWMITSPATQPVPDRVHSSQSNAPSTGAVERIDMVADIYLKTANLFGRGKGDLLDH